MRSEQLQALSDYEASPDLSEQERAVLRLADAMTATPAAISDELFQELRGQFSDRQLTELASALAWENYRARFNRVFLVESEEFSAGKYCPLPIVGNES